MKYVIWSVKNVGGYMRKKDFDRIGVECLTCHDKREIINPLLPIMPYSPKKIACPDCWDLFGREDVQAMRSNGPAVVEAEFEAETEEEAREKFDQWYDSIPRPDECCDICKKDGCQICFPFAAD